MKLRGLHTTSHLWFLPLALCAITPVALAQTGDSSSSQRERLPDDAINLLAQANSVLELGSSGPAVRDLQAMLALMGYYSGAVDGAYEELTAEAVRQFQADAGLTVDGIVGPLTWQRLLPTPNSLAEPQVSEPGSSAPPASEVTEPSDGIADTAGNLPTLMLEDSGNEVSRLQQRLAELNLYSGPMDGEFGPQTQQAVEQFQQQAGLTVDGIVGPATWLALFQ